MTCIVYNNTFLDKIRTLIRKIQNKVLVGLCQKTLKQKEGKVLYVDVKDAITTTTYRIPYETKAKTYTKTWTK